MQGRRSWGSWGLDPLKICMRGQSMFWPPKNLTLFHSKLLLDDSCKFHVIKDERLVKKMEGKSNFRSANRLSWTGIGEKNHWTVKMMIVRSAGECLLETVKFTRLTLTPIFCNRSSPLCVAAASDVARRNWTGREIVAHSQLCASPTSSFLFSASSLSRWLSLLTVNVEHSLLGTEAAALSDCCFRCRFPIIDLLT